MIDALEAGGERLAEDEARLRRGTLGRIDDEKDAVNHRQNALDLSTKVSMAGRVDDAVRGSLRASVLPAERRAQQDADALDEV